MTYDLGCATIKGVATSIPDVWKTGTLTTDTITIDGRTLSGSTIMTYASRDDGMYSGEPKMRRLYQVYIIDLRTDEVDEWFGIATSERAAEFKAFDTLSSTNSDIDNYQFVTKVIANVAERIEAGDK